MASFDITADEYSASYTQNNHVIMDERKSKAGSVLKLKSHIFINSCLTVTHPANCQRDYPN